MKSVSSGEFDFGERIKNKFAIIAKAKVVLPHEVTVIMGIYGRSFL